MTINPFWIEKHHRFGLAGEGQANIIARVLSNRRGCVLNIGCGLEPRHVVNLSYHCNNLVAADHEVKMVSRAAHQKEVDNISFLVADAFNLPLAGGSLDHIVALGLFGYFTDPAAAFREFRRVLRACGNVLLTNSVARPKDLVLNAAIAEKFALVSDNESFCPLASGPTKMRYLLILTPPATKS